MMDAYQLVCISTGALLGICIVNYQFDKRKSNKWCVIGSVALFVIANGLNFLFAYLKHVKGWNL